MMDLSICILTRCQPELLPKCVASCVAEIARVGVSSEVIIIDNASWDGSPQRVASLYPIARLIRNEENLGFSTANNRAIRISQGRNVLVLNDDAMLKEGSLGLMLSALESGSRVGAVGPKLLNPDGSVQRNYTHRRFPRLRSLLCGFLGLDALFDKCAWTRDFFTHSLDPEVSSETDHVAGACLLARREALDAVRLFDESFHYLFEDADLCYRLKQAGWQIMYVAEAQVTHYGSASFNQLARVEKAAIVIRSLAHYFKKHSSPAQNWFVRLTLALFFFVRLPIFCIYRMVRFGVSRREWRDSVRISLQTVRSLLLERP
jgi:N-acetylglucosaminyl-diphospho-decaprenol L-rhamnosyltransferase